jgi:hypothetical protein
MGKLSSFKQGFLGGLSVIAVIVLIFVVGTVAAQYGIVPEDVSEPAGQSEVAESSAIASVNAVTGANGVLQVFQTSTTYNGAGPTGYGRSGMHATCRLEDPTAHFCSLQEIENAWKTHGIDLVLVNQAWVDNAQVGTIDSGYTGDFQSVSDWYGGNAINDHPYNCNAWTVSTNTARGLILNTGAISPAAEACDDNHPIACCKTLITLWVYLPLVER